MKLLAALLSIVSLSVCISGSAAASQTLAAHAKRPAPITVAPADEYFGRLKMSILGIRNTLKDLAQKAEYNPANPEQIFGTAAYAEESLHEWEHRYPADPWLAKSVAGLVHMYSRVPTAAGRAKMHAALAWLEGRYAKTKSIVAGARMEAEAADKAAVSPAAAATPEAGASAPQNAPAPAATNAPAPPRTLSSG